MKHVVVFYPVIVEVVENDTIDRILDISAHYLSQNSIRPIIELPEGDEITTDEELQGYLRQDEE